MAPITFAHRGARLEAPENSLEAFDRALRAGVSGLETDARLSADGEVVLAHDAVVGRGLRRRRVATTPADALAALGVPRLADLYAELGCDFELSVDLKDPAVAGSLVAVADRAGARDRLWCCSPDLEVLAGVPARRVHSDRRRNLGEPLERHAAELARREVRACNLHHSEWTAGLVALFHRFGVAAFAWDAQEARHLRAVIGMGVDAVYCDRPDRMLAAVGEWAPEP